MNRNDLLIIFVKNPELGKVKTRLANSIGKERALKTYKTLLAHTKDLVSSLSYDKAVFYNNHTDRNDIWDNLEFKKHLQTGNDLGEKMKDAFSMAFKRQYKKAVIIGSDCPKLTPKIINDAYRLLDSHDVVIGPAKDGGYYLLGMKKLYKELFNRKKWGFDSVFTDTLADLNKLNVSCKLLTELSDIDREEDMYEMEELVDKYVNEGYHYYTDIKRS